MTEAVYESTKLFPKEELCRLVSQIRRSAISISSNIAEGFGRRYNKEYKQFLHISLGSCAELSTQVTIAERLKYVSKEAADKIIKEADEISRMIMSLIKKL